MAGALAATAALATACGAPAHDPTQGAPPPASAGPTAELPTLGPDVDPDVRSRVESRAAAVTRAPGDAAAWIALARTLHAHGLLPEAVAAYSAGLVRRDDAAARYQRGLALHGLGRSHEALADVEAALALEPGYAPGWRRAAQWRLADHDVGGALASANRARELAPDDAAGLRVACRALLAAGRGDEAVPLLQQRLAQQPRDAQARLLLATALRAAGRGDEARQVAGGGSPESPGADATGDDPWAEQIDDERTGFREALTEALAALAEQPAVAASKLEDLRARWPERISVLVDLGIAYRRAGRLDDSADVLRRAVELAPDQELAQLQLAVTLGTQAQAARGAAVGRLAEEGLRHADRAVALRPGAGRGHAVRGDLLSVAGRLDEAIAAYGRATEREASVEWELRRAMLLSRAGRLAETRAALERAERWAPGDPRVAAARAGFERSASAGAPPDVER